MGEHNFSRREIISVEKATHISAFVYRTLTCGHLKYTLSGELVGDFNIFYYLCKKTIFDASGSTENPKIKR
jgi:hypothetical protein